MNCAASKLECPRTDCLGLADAGVCRLWAVLTELRRGDAPTANEVADPTLRDRALAIILSCPDRGASRPPSVLAECGCLGPELTACGQNKGRSPGWVTTRDCLACRESFLAESPPDDG